MDRLYVSYEKYRRMIAEKKILHRLVQGVRILTVALACYGWWGVRFPQEWWTSLWKSTLIPLLIM